MRAKNWVFVIMIICFTSQIIYGQEKQFMYDGIMRAYVVYEPSLDPNPDGYPLVIGLHGAGATAYNFIANASLIQKANQEQFIVACPNALIYNLVSWWNSGDGYEEICNGTDDVGFISALIDTMIMNYNVDTTRVYIMGFSSGSMMTYRMAAELSYRVAAIGVSSGQMVYEYCNPAYPVPIIHFHGLSDPICPYEGKGDSVIVVPHVDSVMAIWRGINNCSSIPDTILNEDGIIGKKWPSLDGKSDIILYTNQDGEHEWPRPANWGIDATDIIWDFLKLHNRIVVTSIEEGDTRSIPGNFELYQNYPNPFNPITKIHYSISEARFVRLEIYNTLGQKIRTLVNENQTGGNYQFQWDGKDKKRELVSSDLYFYKLQVGDFVETKKMLLMH
jgi:polyhydroxybutyrate depolymerase